MANDQAVQFTTPVGRIVQGGLYTPRKTDGDGKPLVIKTGPNAGQPTQQFYFALAIPKTPGVTHWASESWGAKFWTLGHAAFPAAAQRPDFAWKIEDGDSIIPNKKGRVNAKTEGFPGNWIVKFSSQNAPRCFTVMGRTPNDPQPLTDAGAIKAGYFVQVAGNAAPNTGPNPGIYMNHSMVCLIAYGPEIVFGPDPEQAGFGVGVVALPPGATMTPVGGFVAPAAPVAATAAPPPPAAATKLAPAVPAPVMVTPHTAILTPAPAAPPPLAAMLRQMTAKAAGATYEAMIAAGWNDMQLVQHGYMTP